MGKIYNSAYCTKLRDIERKKNPEIKITIEVNVQDTHPEEIEIVPYIEGPDYILWNNEATFTLSGANGTFCSYYSFIYWGNKIIFCTPINGWNNHNYYKSL